MTRYIVGLVAILSLVPVGGPLREQPSVSAIAKRVTELEKAMESYDTALTILRAHHAELRMEHYTICVQNGPAERLIRGRKQDE